jgi:hypothetical protein
MYCTFEGDPAVGNEELTNEMEKKQVQIMTQNSVNIVLFKGWLLKEQSHFCSKRILVKKLERQKGPVLKTCWSSPFNQA